MSQIGTFNFGLNLANVDSEDDFTIELFSNDVAAIRGSSNVSIRSWFSTPLPAPLILKGTWYVAARHVCLRNQLSLGWKVILKVWGTEREKTVVLPPRPCANFFDLFERLRELRRGDDAVLKEFSHHPLILEPLAPFDHVTVVSSNTERIVLESPLVFAGNSAEFANEPFDQSWVLGFRSVDISVPELNLADSDFFQVGSKEEFSASVRLVDKLFLDQRLPYTFFEAGPRD